MIFRRYSILIAALAVVLGLSAFPSADAQQVPQDRKEIQLSFAPIVRQAAPAVVNVYATQKSQDFQSPFSDDPVFRRFFENGPFGFPRGRARSSLGSGVIVDSGGIVVTNRHVIRGADEVKVALSDGVEFQADIVLRDERSDIAILQIRDGNGAFPALNFGDSDNVAVGDLVLAIGNPFGVGQTVTSGIVSALARTEIGINDLSFFIQTDAAINPGNSGGPLVDMRGNIVGINTAIYSRSGGSNGIGFAIPSNMVRTIVAQALQGNKEIERPWIGATFQKVTPDIARSLELERPIGALVTRVEPDSPAIKADLRVGDLVVSVGRNAVRDPATLEYRLALRGVGKRAQLIVVRRGREIPIVLDLVKAPESLQPNLRVIDGRSPLTGATVGNLSPRLAERLRLPSSKRGVAVVEIDPRSRAARHGFRPGDVILSFQGQDIGSTVQLQEMTSDRTPFWRLSVERRGRVSNLFFGG